MNRSAHTLKLSPAFHQFQVDFKAAFEKLGKAVVSTIADMKWTTFAKEVLSLSGVIEKKEYTPNQKAYILVQSAIIRACYESYKPLWNTHPQVVESQNRQVLGERMAGLMNTRDYQLGEELFLATASLPFIPDVQEVYKEWLIACQVPVDLAEKEADGLQEKIVYNLEITWNLDQDFYLPISTFFKDNPFYQARKPDTRGFERVEGTSFQDNRIFFQTYYESPQASPTPYPLGAALAGQVHSQEYLTPPPPLAPDSFLGREKDLKDIHRMLKEDRPLVLVNGIGGIGKTTLAQKYWEQYEKDYQLKAWIDCPDGLLKGLGNSSLPDSLEIDQSQLTAEKELLSKVVHALSNKGTGPHLLVIDNANEAE